jgi:hypothetical protein
MVSNRSNPYIIIYAIQRRESDAAPEGAIINSIILSLSKPVDGSHGNDADILLDEDSDADEDASSSSSSDSVSDADADEDEGDTSAGNGNGNGNGNGSDGTYFSLNESTS